MCPASPEPILFARLPGGIVVVRVCGKGTHQQSSSLLHVFEQTKDAASTRYVFDMDQCSTMDSTFMGTLASIGLFQRRERGSSVVVTNAKEHVRYLLNTLGLQYILDIRPDKNELPDNVNEETFTPANAPELSPLDRIVMMIEAHERLVDIDSQNEVKFEGVLKSLRESLEREKRRP